MPQDYSDVAAVFPLASYPITGVDTGLETFDISGDLTDRFVVDDTFVVIDSTGNNATYTVASTSYASGPDETTITVNENITNAVADGTILHDEIADFIEAKITHDDATDRDLDIPDQLAGAHTRRFMNEIRGLGQSIGQGLGFPIVDAGGLVIYFGSGTVIFGTAVANIGVPGKLTMTDNTTNYIEVDSSGVVTANASSFTSGQYPLFIVTTLTADITNIQDVRSAIQIANFAEAVGLYEHKGAYDAAANTPDLDAAPSGVKKADAYTVSVAGTFFTELMEVGDVIVADIDNPTVLTDWTRLNKNIDAATVTTKGIVELATDGESAANVVVQGNDARMSDPRAPSGTADGDLNGTYPNPGVDDGADATAIHDNVDGEIAAVAEKTSPIPADLVLIEDSADSNSKKKVQLGNLASPPILTGSEDTDDATTSATYIQAVRITKTLVVADYLIIWSAELASETANKPYAFRLQVDDTVTIAEVQGRAQAADDFEPLSGMFVYTATAASHDFDFDFLSDGAVAATLRRKRISIMKVTTS